MRNRYHVLAIAALATTLAACQGDSPTEPARLEASGSTAAVTAAATTGDASAAGAQGAVGSTVDAARGGNGNGGNGGNGNGRKPPRGGGDQVSAAIQPQTWNTNWEHAEGTFSVVLRGAVAAVDEDSIVLVGEAGEIEPVRVNTAGGQIRARFAMDEAFEILEDADPGETHEVEVHYTTGEGTTATDKEITLRIRVVGPRSAG